MAGTAKKRSAAWELRRMAGRINGVRVAYGKPIRAGDRTIIPVARVRVRGGFGFGSAPRDQGGDGGGGGGTFDAQPVGFIEAGPQGTRYERIPPPRGKRDLVTHALSRVEAGELDPRHEPAAAHLRDRGQRLDVVAQPAAEQLDLHL